MAELRELLIYAVIAVVIIAIVAVVLWGRVFKSTYNVDVSLTQFGPVPVYPYQTSHFLINITNNGSSPMDNVLLGFYLNGSQISTNTISVPAKASIQVIRNYTYQEAGSYDFQAVIDPGHLVYILNRTRAQGTLIQSIMQPQTADVYTSIPNKNIVDTQTYTITGDGVYGSAEIAQRYDIAQFNKLFGPSEPISIKIFESLAPYIGYVNGAYAKYANNSIASTAWIQGTATPQLAKIIVSSFGISTRTLPNNVIFAATNRTTSMCMFYSGGWAKIITYDNASKKGTCSGIANNTFNSTQSQLFISTLKSDTNLTHYQSGFFYTNVTRLGSVLEYDRGNLTATNIFSDQYGFFFASSVRQNRKPANVSALPNDTCYGLIYSSGNVNVCSVVIFTRNASMTLPFGMVNTSFISPNYMLNMYSLVNSSSLSAAHQNAARLISAIGVNSISASWTTGFKNGCSMENTSTNTFNCKFISFNYTGLGAVVNLTNNLGSPVKVNNIGCKLAAGYPNTTINDTIAPGKTLRAAFKCYSLPVPVASAVISYLISVNYTVQGANRLALGVLNITNQGYSGTP